MFQTHGYVLCINIVSNLCQTLDEELDSLSKIVATKWLSWDANPSVPDQVYLIGSFYTQQTSKY